MLKIAAGIGTELRNHYQCQILEDFFSTQFLIIGSNVKPGTLILVEPIQKISSKSSYVMKLKMFE